MPERRLWRYQDGDESQLALPAPRLRVEGREVRLTARLQVPPRWRYFEGHFPDMPIVSGVAQLTEIVLPRIRRAWPELGQLTEVVRLKFKKAVAPGAELDLHVTRELGSTSVQFDLLEGNLVAATGRLKFTPGAEADG